MKHWVFDLDGTLVDSFPAYFSTMEEIFAHHGKSFTSDLHHSMLTNPLLDLFRHHLGEEAVHSSLEWLQRNSNRDASRIPAFAGLASVLETLSSRGKVAVWTNRDLHSANLVLEHSGLGRHVSLCVSGTCVPRRKPSTDGLEKILRTWGCEGKDVVMVGDHEHDVTAARSLGAKAVRASWHGHFHMDPCSHADHQFHSVEEFTDWVRSL